MAQSARGLFRATGKKAHTDLPRAARDYYPTPPEPTLALLASPEGERLRDFPLLWEPANGNGAMTRVLEAAGHAVFTSDISDGHDFFDATDAPAPALVTNPPYQEINWRDGKGRWVTHAMDTLGVEYMALLLSWSWPGAGGHAPLWAEWPPARVYLMRWKIDFTGQGAPPMLNGWFVWDREHRGETVLRMLDKPRNEDIFA
jgi:hypothetical protein